MCGEEFIFYVTVDIVTLTIFTFSLTCFAESSKGSSGVLWALKSERISDMRFIQVWSNQDLWNIIIGNDVASVTSGHSQQASISETFPKSIK